MTKKREIIEDDFNEIKDQVNAKLAEAAKAIREAADIARSKGLPVMDYSHYDWRNTKFLDYDRELAFDVDQVEDAMQVAGWQTSSWTC
jgi:hypothetical protein